MTKKVRVNPSGGGPDDNDNTGPDGGPDNHNSVGFFVIALTCPKVVRFYRTYLHNCTVV